MIKMLKVMKEKEKKLKKKLKKTKENKKNEEIKKKIEKFKDSDDLNKQIKIHYEIEDDLDIPNNNINAKNIDNIINSKKTEKKSNGL
jgi:hypothetical protein